MQKTCRLCKHWKHDIANRQDTGMEEQGYKPCNLDKTKGRYLSGQARACENFKEEKVQELPF